MELNGRRTLERAQKFFGSRIWAVGVGEARRSRALLYRTSRILYATVQGLIAKRVNFRAAALTYYSVLSVVPFLAFAFSVLKGFGFYQRLVDDSIRPYLQQTFGENPTLLTAFQGVLDFVEKTDFSKLGAVGVLVLAYTSISLLSTIETALNDIWEAKTARPLLRQVTDYTTLLVVGPLLMLVALALGTAARSSGIVSFLSETLALEPVIDFALKFTSVVLACVALTALYMIMPNVHTRFRSAILGGLTAGLLWQGALLLYVKIQVGVAGYNAIYAGLGAIPIFLVWLYISWLIVLLGAQLAASHQNEQGLHQAMRARHVDQEVREILAVACSAEITRRFLDGGAPPTSLELTDLLDAPAPTVEEVLNALVKSGVAARGVCGQEIGFLPARDVDAVRVADVREAVRASPEADEIKLAVETRLHEGLRELLRSLDEAAHKGAGHITLRDLAQHALSTSKRPATLHVAPVVDAKQPSVPG
jgi:membrane protein